MKNRPRADERQASWKVLLPAKPGNRLLALGLSKGVLCSLRRSFDCVETSFSDGKYDVVVLDCRSINWTNLSVIDSCIDAEMIFVCINADRQIKENLDKRDYRYVRTYAGLPAGRPRIYIPLNSSRLRTKGLSFHSPGSLKSKAGLLIAKTLSGLGIKFHLMRNAVSVFSANENFFGGNGLTDWIAGKVGYGISDLVVYAGSESERRKITALAVAEKDGEDVVVKIADSAAGTEAIRQESEALHALKSTSLSSWVPELLFEDKWNGYVIQGQSALSRGSRSQGSCLTNVHFTFLADLSTFGRKFVSFRSTRFFQDLSLKLENIPAGSLPPSVTRAWYEILKRDFADRKVLCHRIHGDFAPWNICEQEGRLFVYDWEDSLSEGLALTDALRFVYRQADLVGPWPGSVTMLEKLREVGTCCFSEIGCVEREDYEKYFLAWLVKEYAENRSDRVARMIEHAASEMQL
jgi:hypothetical protein